MTGLDLESFLLLLRADLGVWLMLGLATLGLAFLVWSSWSRRRALRNCLVLSLAAHLALVVFGSAFPGIVWNLSSNHRKPNERSHIREIRVSTLVDPASRRAPELIASSGMSKIKGSRHGERARPAVGPGGHTAGARGSATSGRTTEHRSTNSRPRSTPSSWRQPQPRRRPRFPRRRRWRRRFAPWSPALPRTRNRARSPPAAVEPLPPDVAEIDRARDESKTAGTTEAGRAARRTNGVGRWRTHADIAV